MFLEERPCFSERHIIDFFRLTEFGFTCLSNPEEGIDRVLAPNPDWGVFSLYNATGQDWNSIAVTVMDVNGRTIAKKTGVDLPASESVHVNVGSPAQGLYIAEIRSDKGVARIKFVIAE